MSIAAFHDEVKRMLHDVSVAVCKRRHPDESNHEEIEAAFGKPNYDGPCGGDMQAAAHAVTSDPYIRERIDAVKESLDNFATASWAGTPSDEWRRKSGDLLTALRKLEPFATVERSAKKPVVKRRKESCNDAMRRIVQENPEARWWSVRDWCEATGFVESTVHDTDMWTELHIHHVAEKMHTETQNEKSVISQGLRKRLRKKRA